MAGTGTYRSGRSQSRAKATHRDDGCVACRTVCCCCCKNWCHVCGVRKCRAQRDSKWLNDTLNTEYLREYPPKAVPLDRRRPGNALLDSAPFYGQTTNRADYTPKQARAQSARRAQGPLVSLPFDGRTTYTDEYIKKQADLDRRAKGPDASWSAPFLGATTYNTEYVPKQVRPWTAEPGRPLVSAPWDGTSEYRDNYTKKAARPPDLRASAPLMPSNHVPTITTYGHDYVPKPFESRQKQECCDDPRHPAEHARVAQCCERPWTSCASCAGGSRPGTGLRPTGHTRTR
ncbi:hypothetical protein HXX76_005415 [Chlamydomonas incerta]|uniref:Uncharacterized protein n=1 Tax=Chlamydomonas incerta TaxID=51695 RepID=A0A835THG0_CHLIN|nr:hypothetical protein HXX76_005415 [Chlamydomonas incerta]|eukprot:KAG2437795.1 hypothetical protein HXX76_005415 [Chlamydomonas incerta]